MNKIIGKIIGYLFGFGAISTGLILIFIISIILSVLFISIPLYFVWNYVSSIEGFQFMPHLSFLDTFMIIILIRLLKFAWDDIKINTNNIIKLDDKNNKNNENRKFFSNIN